MPIWEDTYRPPFLFRNGHCNTISAAMLRPKIALPYERERFILEDGDFVDLDFVRKGSTRLVVLMHGLEGSSDRAYIRGMASRFLWAGFDALAFNFRGCSGELNHAIKGYHMAATGDLTEVVRDLEHQGKYREIYLVGFSLGGSVVLRFLAEFPSNGRVRGGVAFSVPLDLVAANRAIDRKQNVLYRIRFLHSLKKKMRAKRRLFPEALVEPPYWKNNFTFFDNYYTAPVHGFRDARDYWEKAGPGQILPNLRHPCLLVNARDDSFLSPHCYPDTLAARHPYLYFCSTRWGGHTGFMPAGRGGYLWSEDTALRFIQQIAERKL